MIPVERTRTVEFEAAGRTPDGGVWAMRGREHTTTRPALPAALEVTGPLRSEKAQRRERINIAVFAVVGFVAVIVFALALTALGEALT